MNQIRGTSTEVQSKLLHFLEEEFSKFKEEHQKALDKRIIKRKNIDKKRQKLSQKVEFMLNIHSLDSEIKETLLSLQQEIRNFS